MKDSKGEPLKAEDMMYSAEMSGDGVLAFISTFLVHDTWEWQGQITFLDVESGETYNIALWDLIDKMTCADEYESAWFVEDPIRFCWVE